MPAYVQYNQMLAKSGNLPEINILKQVKTPGREATIACY